MHYTLNQLQIFLKISQTQSITKAAEELFLTQPAVSIQLKNFQAQFDIPLTEVVGRKLYITDFGKEVAVAAEKILNEAYAINFKTSAYKGQLTGRLKLSVVSTGKYVMPYFLTGFIQKNPGIELVMDVTNKSKVITTLENNEVDFALVSILPEKISLNKIDLLENKLYLMVNHDTKVSKLKSTRELLEESPLIFREPGSGTRQSMERFIERHHLAIRKKIELTSNEAVKQAVLAGLGFSIMPLIGVVNELEKKTIKIIPAKGLPIKTMWQLIWLKEKKLSPIAEAYLNYVKEEKAAIIQKHFHNLESIKPKE